MKKLLSILLAAVMLFGLLPATAPPVAAADIVDSGTCGENLTWTLDSEGTLTISGTGRMYSYYFSAPPWSRESIKKVVVEEGITHIGSEAFSKCENLTNVTLPSSLISIESYAFRGCRSLEEVSFSQGLECIYDGAFKECDALMSVVIPESVTKICREVFSYCDSLTTVKIHSKELDLDEKVFYSCPSLREVEIDALTSCGHEVFAICPSLVNVTLGDGVTWLGREMFAWCKSLRKIVIPSSVQRIGLRVFQGCESLTSVILEEGITDLGTQTFEDCTALKTMVIPSGVTALYGTFLNCSALTSLYFRGDAPSPVGNSTFQVRYGDTHYEMIPNLTIYYVEGTEGWRTPTWERCPTATWDPSIPIVAQEFSDVPANAWYTDALQYAMDNALMNGMGQGKFQPETRMNRAMLVTILWRYAGEPEGGNMPFTDVAAGQWFTEAIAWAASNGIVTGVSETRFDPNGNVTREQLATILYRFCQKAGVDTSQKASLSGFPDGKEVESWAQEAMRWAVGAELINGIAAPNATMLRPQGDATRAQVATIFMRFIENVMKA